MEYGALKSGENLAKTFDRIKDIQLWPASSDAVVQRTKVYYGPTRKSGEGFDEDAMYRDFSQSMNARELEEKVGDDGFRYAGDTNSNSKANTDMKTKKITINKSLSEGVAVLSFAYELRNASQASEYLQIQELFNNEGSEQLATEYAERILRREARSVLFRSEVAIALNKESLVVNPRYNDIAKKELSTSAKLEEVYQELRENGTVNQGQKKAFEHYHAQFLAHAKKKI